MYVYIAIAAAVCMYVYYTFVFMYRMLRISFCFRFWRCCSLKFQQATTTKGTTFAPPAAG